MWNEAETWGIIWDKIEGLLDQVSVKNVLLVWNTTESYTKSTVSVCSQRIKSKSHLIFIIRSYINKSKSPIRYTSQHISRNQCI